MWLFDDNHSSTTTSRYLKCSCCFETEFPCGSKGFLECNSHCFRLFCVETVITEPLFYALGILVNVVPSLVNVDTKRKIQRICLGVFANYSDLPER